MDQVLIYLSIMLDSSNIPLVAVFLFLLGLCLGSFFNVVIGRWPAGMSVVSPPSRCPKCGKGIRWHDNVPVLGWLMLGGKCRDCKNPISAEYPIVELITGILTASPCLWAWYGIDISLEQVLGLSLLLACSVPIVLIDQRHFLIPDIVVWPAAAVAVAISFLPGGLTWLDALLGALGASAVLWAFAWIMSKMLGREAMGMGDVQLMVLLGAVLGWKWVALTLPLASIFGLLGTALMKVLPERWRPKSADPEIPAGSIPFGPYLCLGAIVTYLCGPELFAGYLNLMGLADPHL